jgi:hypothetical protein
VACCRKGDANLLNINDIADDTLTLDIPDELPAHLAGEEVHLTQNMSQDFDPFSASSQASSRRSLRGKQAITMQERASIPSNDSFSETRDDMSEMEMLAPGEGEDFGGVNPLDLPDDDLDESLGSVSKKSSSKALSASPGGLLSSSGQGDAYMPDEFDMGPVVRALPCCSCLGAKCVAACVEPDKDGGGGRSLTTDTAGLTTSTWTWTRPTSLSLES